MAKGWKRKPYEPEISIGGLLPLMTALEERPMPKKTFAVSVRIRSLVDFCGVPKGTEGVIDEDYGSGFMIAWDLPDRPLPKGYRVWDGKPACASPVLRDGFDKESELHFLEIVR